MLSPRNLALKIGASLSAGIALAVLSGATVNPQPLAPQGGRPDQVYLKNSTRQESGVVTENSLTHVLLMRGDKERRVESGRVDRIVWGAVSAAYREGGAYFERGDYENAAAKFGLAATDDERDVIKADARLLMGESLLRLGAADPSQFGLALDEFERFLGDYPESRSLPRARSMQARATWLRGNEGDVAAAGALYRSLFEAGSGATPTEGYDKLGSYEAGVQAVRALTAAGDTLGAREISGIMTGGVAAMAAELEEGSPEALHVAQIAAEIQLAEGFVQIASEQARQAETFFNSQIGASTDSHAALRFGAMLGLGEALLAQGKDREASVQFAIVASIDYTDRDRTAKALLLLAETMVKLEDSDGVAQARKRLNVILESFGDTPSAAQARKMLATL